GFLKKSPGLHGLPLPLARSGNEFGQAALLLWSFFPGLLILFRSCPELFEAFAGGVALGALVFRQSVFNRDLLMQARRLFPCRHLEQPVQVEIELHDDLIAGRHVAQALDAKRADLMIIADVLTFALEDVD